jgi:hypothetical protein
MLICGFLHSDPAVVGRKSGSHQNANADSCTICLAAIVQRVSRLPSVTASPLVPQSKTPAAE